MKLFGWNGPTSEEIDEIVERLKEKHRTSTCRVYDDEGIKYAILSSHDCWHTTVNLDTLRTVRTTRGSFAFHIIEEMIAIHAHATKQDLNPAVKKQIKRNFFDLADCGSREYCNPNY